MSDAVVGRLRNTREASKYLTDRGVPVKPSTLDKLRCVGGGPRFRKIGGKYIAYGEAELDEFADAKISPLLTSTSDPKAAA
jgi:hypothetical protein